MAVNAAKNQLASMNAEKLRQRIAKLHASYAEELERWWAKMTPFEVLVATILSQNSTDRNAILAFENLKRRFLVTEGELARLKPEEVEGLIKVAGLQRQKARSILEAAKVLEWVGGLEKLLKQPPEVVREELLKLPGVGEKTVDVVLALCKGCDVVPIDTHLRRVAKRLGAKGNSYKQIQRFWERLIEPEKRAETHFSLLRFGREVCKSKQPLCVGCVLSDVCPSRL